MLGLKREMIKEKGEVGGGAERFRSEIEVEVVEVGGNRCSLYVCLFSK